MATAELKGKATLNAKSWQRSLRRLRWQMRGFGKQVGESMRRMRRDVAVAGVAVGAGLAAAVKGVANYGDSLDKMSKRTGISTEELARYKHAAELSGASITGLEKSVARMAGTINDAGQGLKTYTRVLGQAGLKAEDFAGLSPDEAFEKMLLAVAAIEDPLERSAVALRIFGRQGRQLLPMLEGGAKGLAAMKREADDLGLVIGGGQAENAAAFNDQIQRLKGSLMGLAIQAINFDKMNMALKRLKDAVIDFRKSATFARVVKRLGQVGSALINVPFKVAQAWARLTDDQKASMKRLGKNTGIAMLALRTGLLGPTLNIVAAVMQAFRAIPRALLTAFVAIAGFKLGKILSEALSLDLLFPKIKADFRYLGALMTAPFRVEWGKGFEARLMNEMTRVKMTLGEEARKLGQAIKAEYGGEADTWKEVFSKIWDKATEGWDEEMKDPQEFVNKLKAGIEDQRGAVEEMLKGMRDAKGIQWDLAKWDDEDAGGGLRRNAEAADDAVQRMKRALAPLRFAGLTFLGAGGDVPGGAIHGQPMPRQPIQQAHPARRKDTGPKQVEELKGVNQRLDRLIGNSGSLGSMGFAT